ncbi:hypothetical protein FDX19_05550 [Citrobacter sp. wls619]|uniref:hypothetical protein n=1 Tax=Citrobacter sp. wls619 TaxID=2576432 RepID=UPI0010CA109A|nr:hypothetical protein [Citrobacter sp. wls619]TKV11699.1 hypothetical protein FDX19_05550 [Citrobacter sp. wls619]
MYSILRDTRNSSMPVWFTITEAVDIINRRTEHNIKFSDICRMALYGHITLSVYFQSPVLLRQVSVTEDNAIQSADVDTEDITTHICHLSRTCILSNDFHVVKTEGDYISPSSFILDTPLQGPEYAVIQRLLARELNIPAPVTGQFNIHCGVLVQDSEKVLYQVFESSTIQQRISRQLQHLPVNVATHFHEELCKAEIKNETAHFPVYHFPDDACFVIKYEELERFIQDFLSQQSSPKKIKPRISTPVSRLLWLACKHNDSISQLVDHPYKLLSVFEEWADHDGITDHFSGETLKTALERGSPPCITMSV